LADNTPVIHIVGAESLLGREVVDVLGSAKLPAHVKVVAAIEPDESATAILTAQKGEAVVLSPLRPGELAGSRVVILADTAASPTKVLEAVQSEPNPPVVVDLTGALEDNPAARLRTPMVETKPPPAAPIYVIAHPAGIALALFLKQLATVGQIRRVVAHVFEPASERGKKGLDELQQQTVGLLAFQKLKKEVFDTQVSFNMLPQYGAEAVKSLEDVEAAVERHLATLLSSDPTIPMPSLRVVHAPVFHGHSFSVWVEFENRPGTAAITATLDAAHIDVRSKDVEPPSNVGVAGQSGITVGSIVPDRNDPRACWFWIVADNLRIASDNAVEVAREILA
jgi:aspartate-semialdehyde dehydrogenase